MGSYFVYYWSFQNVFGLDFGAFSTFKYRVNGGTNSGKYCVISTLILMTYWIFISGVLVHR